MHIKLGRGNSVGVATCYEMDGAGIETRWRRDLPDPPRPTLRPTQPPAQLVSVLFPGEYNGRGVELATKPI